MNDYSDEGLGSFLIDSVDITHKPKRKQHEINAPSNSGEKSAVPVTLTIERAIHYYEERVSKSPEPNVPVNLIPLYMATSKWLRQLLNRSYDKEGNADNSEVQP